MLLPLAHPEDVRALTAPQRKAVVAALLRVEREPDYGKALEPLRSHQRHRGDLSSLRVVQVPGPHEVELRVVYRVTAEGHVEVVAVAPRRGSACYQLAADRLYPEPRRRVRPILTPTARRRP